MFYISEWNYVGLGGLRRNIRASIKTVHGKIYIYEGKLIKKIDHEDKPCSSCLFVNCNRVCKSREKITRRQFKNQQIKAVLSMSGVATIMLAIFTAIPFCLILLL